MAGPKEVSQVKRVLARLTPALVAIMVAASCGEDEPQPTAVLEPTVEQPAAAEVAAPEPTPTATPLPPTVTPTPSPTASPTPAPSPTPASTPTPEPTAIFQPGVIILPTVAPAKPPRALKAPPSSDRALDGINLKVNVARRLSTKAEVEREFISRDDLAVRLREELDEEKEDLLHTERLYKTIGILDQDADLYELWLTLLGEGALGFYDSDDNRLYVVRDSDEFGPAQVIVYVHEFVHGLQDQHFDLESIRGGLEDNADGAFAFRALTEGDATLLEFLYASLHMSEEEQEAARTPPSGQLIAAFRSAPRVIQREYIFPAQEGVQFVFGLYGQNGFDAVSQAYVRLPESTEQILHPEKYEAGESPVQVVLPDVLQSLGEGWTVVDEDTLGEFILQAYLEALLAAEDASAAGEGWGGDRYVLLSGPGGESVVLLKAQWDTEEDAAEFANAFATFTQLRTDDEWEGLNGSADNLTIMLPDQVIFLGIDGQEIVVIFAPDRAIMDATRSAIPRADEIGG